MASNAGGPILDLMTASSAVDISTDLNALWNHWARICVEQGGASQAWFAQVDELGSVYWRTGWPVNSSPKLFPLKAQDEVLQFGKAITFTTQGEFVCGGIFPILRNSQVVGLIGLASNRVKFFGSATASLVKALTEMMTLSIAQLEKQTRHKQAEYSINSILQSSLKLRNDLPVVLGILTELVNADAAIVIKHDPISRKDHLFAAHGFDARALAKVHMYAGAGLAKRNLMMSGSLQVENFLGVETIPREMGHFVQDGFQAHIALPLKSRWNLLGLLEIFWRQPQETEKDVKIIENIGESISWAIERTSVTDDLRRQNDELISTYTATIEGLSRALELRDLETEGHTRRVSALTLRLAIHMQIPTEQHASIQQGALLHDIGKLGIPDAILLKPGSLTSREWKVMQQHPMYAYNILAPITSLHQSLDIPLYHHERWNGSGYPYGLKGEQIPLAARLFAVVDVYDALTSDRPYRAAWPRTQVLTYLREQAGQQFDPQVVEKFLELMEN